MVTPFAGVWIEMGYHDLNASNMPVTPFAGVWIEIAKRPAQVGRSIVTPFAGVWIEIDMQKGSLFDASSLPSRECGLKCPPTTIRTKRYRHSLRGSVD